MIGCEADSKHDTVSMMSSNTQPQASPRSSRKRYKDPVAYISVTGNADHEETPLRKYIGFINSLRQVSKAPPLTLYSSMLGPRIRDRFHIYDPIIETITFCTLKDEAEQFAIANLDQRTLLEENLRNRVRKEITHAVSRTHMNPCFKDDVAPQVLYVNPVNLRRVQPPAMASTLQSSSVSSHKQSNRHDNISSSAVAFRVAETHQYPSDLLMQLRDPSNTWSLANLKSSILLIRFIKVLNRIRRQNLGLPPYTVYWTAATRNKQLRNPRLGLILWDPITSELLYTGSLSDSYSGTKLHEFDQENTDEKQTRNVAGVQRTSDEPQHRDNAIVDSQHLDLEGFVRNMLVYIRASRSEKLTLEEEFQDKFRRLVELMKVNDVPITARGPATLCVAYSNTLEKKVEDWIAVGDEVNLIHGMRCKNFNIF